MKSQNSLAKRIDTAGSIASYDEACKQLLANKVILAWILKYSTKEFADYDIYEIAEKYISKSINSNDKKKILSEEFKINMTKEMEGSVSDMCNLGQGIYDDGYNEGYDSGHDESIVNNINNLMNNTGWDIEKCIDALGIDEEEKEKYKEIIMNDTINV